MIRCKEALSEHVYKYKTLAKLYYQRMWAEHISEGDFTAVPQHVTAQQRYCKQEQVYQRYIDISCQHVIWADLAFPVSMSGNWAEW